MNNRILVGSRAFFSGIDGFNTDNRNFIKLVHTNAALLPESKLSIHGNITYRMLREPASSMVAKVVESDNALLLGNFLVPQVAKEIGLSVSQLDTLLPLAAKLPAKLAYQSVILQGYITNGSFTLTAEQREAAYAAYCSARQAVENETETTAENNE